jgi:hypothetical protein
MMTRKTRTNIVYPTIGLTVGLSIGLSIGLSLSFALLGSGDANAHPTSASAQHHAAASAPSSGLQRE